MLTLKTGTVANRLTSLIISISLKVRRSSQSTFTMWPCRWAFVSWIQREKESQGDGERGEKNTETDGAAKTSHSMAADMQTGQPIMHKTSEEANSGCPSHTLTEQLIHLWVSVGVRNVSTHGAMNRRPRISIGNLRSSAHKRVLWWFKGDGAFQNMAKILSWCPNIRKTLEKCVCKRSRHITTAGMSSRTFTQYKGRTGEYLQRSYMHTQTHCTGSSNSHHQVPPDQDSGTDHGLDLYFSFSQPPYPVFQTVPSFDSTL